MGHGCRAITTITAAAIAIALGAAGCGGNPQPHSPVALEEGDPPDANEPAGDEARFALALLHAAYEGEEELAELARERAQSPRLRAHAEDLLEDYERLDPQVTELAEQFAVDLDDPEGVAAQVMSELGEAYDELGSVLEAADAEEFDQAYLNSLVATHQATLFELERIEPGIAESEVRELVQNHIPLIRRHLERARDVAEREGIQV